MRADPVGNEYIVYYEIPNAQPYFVEPVEALTYAYRSDRAYCRRLPSASPLCSPVLAIRHDSGVSLRYTEGHLV